MLWLLLIALLILVAVGALAFFASRRSLTTDADEHKEISSDCCGAHEVCERDSLLSKTNQIIYFDDEELDVLSGKDAATYTIEEQKQLEEVFLTLRESDVTGWLRSLQLRNIALPDELKEQALLIVRERRHLL